jgi:hypothetical protein
MRQQAKAREEAFVNLVATVASDQQSAAGVRQVKVRSATQGWQPSPEPCSRAFAFREPPLRREFGGPNTPEQNDVHALSKRLPVVACVS